MDIIYNAINYKVIAAIQNIEQLNSYYDKDSRNRPSRHDAKNSSLTPKDYLRGTRYNKK